MTRRHILAVLGLAASVACGLPGCDTESALGNQSVSSSGASSGGGSSGGGSGGGDDGGGGGDDGPASGDGGGCAFSDNAQFCACQGWTCGGFTAQDKSGNNQVVYCGECPATQYCLPDKNYGAGVGTCGGTNPLVYRFQKQKIDMLVSMGENDNTIINYGYAKNIGDGRGYTVGKVGFCTGTGDFIVVAQCYNIRKPGNVLQKYWSALVAINDAYVSSGKNQADTSKIDAVGNFVNDVAAAAAEAPPGGQVENDFQICQDSLADADYLSAAAAHMQERGLQSALAAGFLYDTELNFGDEDDPSGTAGTKTVMARADKDYGSALPKSFAGLPWEESRWLGYLIKERTLVMVTNSTWKTAIDQNSTWEAARRLSTASSNNPESGTKLDLDFDLVSQYQAGAAAPPTPCWAGLPNSPAAGGATVYTVKTDKSGGASSDLWTAIASKNANQTYVDCPKNPTP